MSKLAARFDVDEIDVSASGKEAVWAIAGKCMQTGHSSRKKSR